MSRLGLLVLAGVLVSEAAIGADMPATWTPPASLPSPVVTTTRITPKWYVRGDVGYAWFRTDGAVSAPGFPNPTGNDLGQGLIGGAGVGYKSTWARTDATLDYTAMTYSGTVATAGDTTANVSALTALFNGYLDLGTWYGLSPYVGAGAGASRINTSNYKSTTAPPFTAGLSNTQWKFAWALMAGTAYSVTPNVDVDLGYRFLDLGDVSTASDSAGATTLKNLAAHEVRVGVRWSFDDVPLSVQ